MSWPLPHDFNEAVQNPKVVFSDPDLKSAQTVVGATGLPLPRSGNFADVYQLRGLDGKDRAVKCFTRPVVGLAERYEKVSTALGRASLPFTIGFTFLSDGIRVGGSWRPVVKMEWVEGLQLNQVVRENAGRPQVLAAMRQLWVKLCKRLREAGIAHADLQHGNVLLVPGSRPGAYSLKLIDYDGMYIPALANQPSGEVGHPSYQHPARAAGRVYSPDLDRFPHLVVATALKGVEVGGQALWDRYDTGDNLLFTEDDFRAPAESKLMKELWRTENPAVQSFVGHLAISCGRPIPQTPWLDQLAPEGEPASLDEATRRAAAVALGVALPVPVALPLNPPVALPLPAEPLSLDSDPGAPSPLPGGALTFEHDGQRQIAMNRSGTKRNLQPSGRKQPSYVPLAVACGVLVLAVGVVSAIVLSRGGKPKAEENPTEEPKPVEQKPKEKDPPPKKENDPPPKKEYEPPVEPKKVAFEPIELRPVGRLDYRERWKHELGEDVPVARLTVGSDGKAVVVSGFNKIGTVALGFEDGKPLPGPVMKLVTVTRGVTPLPGGRFALPPLTATAPIPVWDPAAGRKLEPLPPVGEPVKTSGQTFVSPNARYVAFGANTPRDMNGPFRLRDLVENRMVLEFEWARGNVLFTADSSRVLVADGSGRCRWYKLPSGAPDGEEWTIRKLSPGWLGPCTASADGSVVLHEGQLVDHPEFYHLLDGRNGRVLRSYSGYVPVPQHGELLSEDGRLVLLGRREANRMKSFDAIESATGAVVARVHAPAGADFLSCTLARDATAVVAVAVPETVPPAPRELAQTVYRYDLYPEGSVPKDPPKVALAELVPKWTTPADSKTFFYDLHADPEFHWIILGNSQGPAAVRDFRTGEPRAGFPGLSRVIDYHPMMKGRLATRSMDAKSVQIWDLKTGRPAADSSTHPILDIPAHPAVAAGSPFSPFKTVRMSPNGRFMIVAWNSAFHRPGTDPEVPLRVFDTFTDKPILSIDWRCGSLHFTADSSRLLVAELGGRFRWYKFPGGQPDGGWQYDAPPLDKPHLVTDLSADGSRLAYAGPGKKGTTLGLAVVNGQSGDLICRFNGDVDAAARLLLSEDGRRAAYPKKIEGKATIELADAATGAAFARVVAGPDTTFPTFTLTADGRALVVHDSKAGKLHLFEVPTPKSP